MKHALIVTALVSLCACSGVTKVGEQPSWRDQGGTGEAPEGPLVLVPQSPRPGYYNAQKRGVVPESETFDAIEEAVAKAAAEAEIPAPDKDPRLYQACADLAAAVRPDDPMPYDMIATALHWHGIVEPSPHVVIAVGDSGDTGAILEKLAPELPALLASGRIARMGIGKSERDDGQAVTVLAFQESFIDLKPVPRKVPVGATIALQGVVKAPYTQPEVYVTEATGKVKTLPLVRFDGGGFRARATCGSELGRMQIEIAAGDATGSAVLANFPVWCGTEPPERVTAAAADDHRDPPATEAEAATRLLALINGARKKQGLQPLVADPALDAVAHAHSLDMRATGVVAHISPTTGSAADRVHAAGIRTGVVLENVARAYSLAEGHRGLMASPGHRANILSKEATHAGIGVTFGKATTVGRREVFITEVFIRRAKVIDIPRAKARVQQRIREVRALAQSAVLDGAAQGFADAIAGGATMDQAAAAAATAVQSSPAHFASVTTLATTVADLAQFDPEPTMAANAGITHYGIGIARGSHEVIGDNAIFIVVLFATDRGGTSPPPSAPPSRR